MGEDVAARGADSLVAEEEHVVASVAEHGLEVVHHPAAGAHARAGDDEQLVEGQRVAAVADAGGGFLVPVALELAVEAGEVGRERGVDDDVELLPGWVVAGLKGDVFDFIEQLLGAADAEGGHDEGAVVGQRVLEHEAVGARGPARCRRMPRVPADVVASSKTL